MGDTCCDSSALRSRVKNQLAEAGRCAVVAKVDSYRQPAIADGHAFFFGPTKLTTRQAKRAGFHSFKFNSLPGRSVMVARFHPHAVGSVFHGDFEIEPVLRISRRMQGLLVHYLRKPGALEWLAALVGQGSFHFPRRTPVA